MRAPAQDTRLEAIAGKPAYYADEPLTLPETSTVRTAIFGGLWVQEPKRLQQLVALGAGVPRVYAADEPKLRLVTVGGAPGVHGTHGRFGWAAVTTALPVSLGTYPTGQVTYLWRGPMRAVAYDRVLTQAQQDAVIRWLIRDLQL